MNWPGAPVLTSVKNKCSKKSAFFPPHPHNRRLCECQWTNFHLESAEWTLSFTGLKQTHVTSWQIIPRFTSNILNHWNGWRKTQELQFFTQTRSVVFVQKIISFINVCCELTANFTLRSSLCIFSWLKLVFLLPLQPVFGFCRGLCGASAK